MKKGISSTIHFWGDDMGIDIKTNNNTIILTIAQSVIYVVISISIGISLWHENIDSVFGLLIASAMTIIPLYLAYKCYESISKNNKWPYIVTLLFSAISIFISIGCVESNKSNTDGIALGWMIFGVTSGYISVRVLLERTKVVT